MDSLAFKIEGKLVYKTNYPNSYFFSMYNFTLESDLEDTESLRTTKSHKKSNKARFLWAQESCGPPYLSYIATAKKARTQ